MLLGGAFAVEVSIGKRRSAARCSVRATMAPQRSDVARFGSVMPTARAVIPVPYIGRLTVLTRSFESRDAASIMRGMPMIVGRIRPFIPFAIAAWLAAGTAAAEEPARFDWRGTYVGLHAGGALGLVDVADPYGASIYGDKVRTPGVLAGGQLGYNWQHGAAVYGLEADLSWADMDGTRTCFAFSGIFTSSNCMAHVNAMGTFAGRLGWTVPFDNRTLVYGKAGLAFAHIEVDAVPSGGDGLPGTRASNWHWGWMFGVGVERAILPNWTVKAEYAYLGFGNESFTAPASLTGVVQTPTPATGTSFSRDIHQFKIGMNYKFDADHSSGQGQVRQLAGVSGAANGTQYKASSAKGAPRPPHG
jgi:opacity protein-like surface antigen